jgi:hypothetical protein
MHLVAHSYPRTATAYDAKRYRQFFTAIAGVLPCEGCRVHFQRQLRLYPFPEAVPSRRKVAVWLFKHHNLVTKRIHPTARVPRFEQIAERYERLRGA